MDHGTEQCSLPEIELLRESPGTSVLIIIYGGTLYPTPNHLCMFLFCNTGSINLYWASTAGAILRPLLGLGTVTLPIRLPLPLARVYGARLSHDLQITVIAVICICVLFSVPCMTKYF